MPSALLQHGPWSPPSCFDDLELLRVLGAGGMGSVYRAIDRRTGDIVAVKFSTPQVPDRTARCRFEREIWALRRIHHPNVLAFHRSGTVEDRPYLVSDLIGGPRVDELATGSWVAALHVGQGAARALAAAHAAGVLHRDVKPANLMLTVSRDVTLIDFGLARPVTPAAPREGACDAAPGYEVTQVGSIVGTPHYLSPEVWTGDAPSVASDVHALGMVMYELIAGRVPFADLRGEDIAHAMRDHDLPLLARRYHHVPVALVALVDRMVARDPAARPVSADVVAAELDAIEDTHRDTVAHQAPFALRRRGRAARRTAPFSEVVTLSRVGDHAVAEAAIQA
jgi:eukaryotic-like serine/threonine-protein kinase